MTIHDLPAVNATLNGIATVFLTIGYVFIRTGRRDAHRNCMVAAFVTSCVFLVFYVLHKIAVRGVHTPFGGEGFIRPVYYVMLISHILLAMAIVPLVIVTFRRVIQQRWEAHRKIARWTWPIWMYVSVTGVLVYFMLYRWFPVR
jgi:putative membrane protein